MKDLKIKQILIDTGLVFLTTMILCGSILEWLAVFNEGLRTIEQPKEIYLTCAIVETCTFIALITYKIIRVVLKRKAKNGSKYI